MTKPMIKIHDIETDEIIEREMNAEELAQLAIDENKAIADLTKLQEVKIAKEAAEAKLAALGLTTDDLKALGL